MLKYYIKDYEYGICPSYDYVKVFLRVKRDGYDREERIKRVFTLKEWKIIEAQKFLIEDEIINY